MQYEKNLKFQDPREFVFRRFLSILSDAKNTGELRKPYVWNAFKIIRAFSYNPHIIGKDTRDTLIKLKGVEAQRILDGNRFDSPNPKILKGDIYVGNTIRGNLPVFIPLRRINENIGIWGRLGIGKTNLCILICIGLYNLGVPIRIFDYKDEYRNFLPYFDDMLVLNRIYDLLNFLEAIGDPKSHIQFIGDGFQQDFNLRPETKFLLISYIDNLYKKFGVYENSKTYPNIYNLREYMLEEANKPSTSSAKKRKIYTCVDIFNSIIKSLGSMLDCNSGYTEARLKPFRIIVYEMPGLNSNLQSFLTKIRLNDLYHTCFSEPKRNVLKTAMVFEEARMLFSEGLYQGSTLIDYIIQIYTRGRFSGSGSILTDQNKNKLADFALNNLSCQFCFNMALPQEIRPMALSLGCSEEQIKEFHNLDIPRAIMSLAGHPPFMIRIPKVPVPRQIFDDELAELAKQRLQKLSFTPTSAPARLKAGMSHGVISEPKIKSLSGFLREIKAFLLQIKSNPELNITKLYASLKLSGRRGDRIKQQLLDNGLIEEIIMRTGEKKRPSKKLRLTEKGERVLSWLKQKVKEA